MTMFSIKESKARKGETTCLSQGMNLSDVRIHFIVASFFGRTEQDWLRMNGSSIRPPEGSGLKGRHLRDNYIRLTFLSIITS